MKKKLTRMEASLNLQDGPITYEKKWYASIPFWKQLLVCSSVWTMFFMTGMLVGAPTVFIPQIKAEINSTYKIEDETISWLYSVYGISAVPWVFIVPTISQIFGRRLLFIIAGFNTMLVFAVLFFSTTTKQILISEIMQGYFQSCNLSLCIIIVSEYAAPRYRGMFLTLKTASFCWGFWTSNAIGTFFHWKFIPVAGMIICLHTFTSFIWPESPQWLASRGRFEECVVAFRWLNGYNTKSESELKQLIESQRVYLKERKQKSFTILEYVSIEFYKPLFIMLVLLTQYFFTGKFVSSIYILDIVKKITGSERTAYTGMLVLDGVTVLGVYCGCFLTRIINRRTMYLASSSIGLIILFIIALYLYLVKLMFIVENKILTVLLLTCLAVVMNSGPMALTTTFCGEIIPLKYKGSMFMLVSGVYMSYSTLVLKTAPQVFKALGLHGTFLMYGIVTAVCTTILYYCLPETKDKTLQQIEEEASSKRLLKENDGQFTEH
ncbi:facilitated trehalose transporter Tret1-like [Battus philenor]|uniref:facilitated trehalose transporter Tret1-like n=1 Tax=Battus philenor TaxID=42288 RepID=UPI0035CFAAE4